MTVQASNRLTISHCLMETLDGERRNVVFGGKTSAVTNENNVKGAETFNRRGVMSFLAQC